MYSLYGGSPGARPMSDERSNAEPEELAKYLQEAARRLRAMDEQQPPVAWKYEWQGEHQREYWLTDYVEKGWEPPKPYSDLTKTPLYAQPPVRDEQGERIEGFVLADNFKWAKRAKEEARSWPVEFRTFKVLTSEINEVPATLILHPTEEDKR